MASSVRTRCPKPLDERGGWECLRSDSHRDLLVKSQAVLLLTYEGEGFGCRRRESNPHSLLKRQVV